MKASEFKTLIKESVKEVFQEELKEIILESLRSKGNTITENMYQVPSYGTTNPINPGFNTMQNVNPDISTLKTNLRESYAKVLGDTAFSFNSSNVVAPFNPAGADSINGQLPEGEVSMGQIMNLMGKK